MIYFIGFVCLILLVFLKWQADEAKALDKKWRKEQEEHYAARSSLSDLEKELDEWKEKYWAENRLSFTPDPDIKQAEPEEPESFVRRTNVTRATAETYKNVFDFDHNGQRILEDLTIRFCKSTYVRGGQDAERESCFRAGQNSVVQTILNQINKANDPNYNEEQDND